MTLGLRRRRVDPHSIRRATPPIAPLLVVLGLGLVLRVYATVVYSTVTTIYYNGDAARFMRSGFDGMFSDGWQPAGYPLFLRGVREITSWLPVTITLQHAAGLATAALLYAMARRAGVGPRLSLLPAAWVALSVEHLFLEQTFLTEAIWTFLLAGALYAAIRGMDAHDLRWLAAGGAILGLSAITRNVSVPLIAVFPLWALVAWGGAWQGRLRAAAVTAGAALAIVVAYSVVATSVGDYSGLGEMRGWSLYQRVGQFADCSKFTPPDGTSGLCVDTPPDQRPGPFHWYFNPESPAWQAFPSLSPDDDDEVGAFARAAIIHQPADYARAVAKDVARYFDPHVGAERAESGTDASAITFTAGTDATYVAKVDSQYSGFDPTPNRGAGFLESYGAIFRLSGFLLLALIVLSAIALLRGPRAGRAALVLCATSALVLLVTPPAVSSYDGRYAIPPAALLTVSAAAGLAVLARRT